MTARPRNPEKTANPLLRNVAIIAHVDHGKTTLVDAMLSQSGVMRANEIMPECVLDSNPLERERGITIFSKNCAVTYQIRRGPRKGEVYRVNIIDTPGHADFGGEVERVLRMADGALLLVDAFDGPMPQTRFVLSKALHLGLKPIVVVNKCDRPEARPNEVVNEVFDLLVALGADDHALDFPIVFASGREGWATRDLHQRPGAPGAGAGVPSVGASGGGVPGGDVDDLFQTIVDHVPPPEGDISRPLQMLVTTLDYSDYVGRIAIGRVFSGKLASGQNVAVCKADGSIEKGRALRVLRFEGLGRREAAPGTAIEAGDLCAVEGLPGAEAGVEIGDTIADPENPVPMPRVAVDEPTLHMVFRINDSPFAGREGKFVTSRQIAERLEKELHTNVALRVAPGETPDEFKVSGRGLLHLGVLLENMRREGYEISVGRPEVIEKVIDGTRCEPIERLSVDTTAAGLGPALELLGTRGGEIGKVEHRGERMHIECDIPARGLIGLRSKMLNATGGEAVMHHSFDRYEPVRSVSRKRINGVMIATENGSATTFAIRNLDDRGVLFVEPGMQVYAGQVVGEHCRDNDLPVNIVKAKQLSNVRESNKEAMVTLKVPRLVTLEAALEYIEPDELVEITPRSVRIRKRLLSENERKRAERKERGREKVGSAA
jgi:GTP-binding protein